MAIFAHMADSYNRQKATGYAAWRVFSKYRPEQAKTFEEKVTPTLRNTKKIRAIWARIQVLDVFDNPNIEILAFVATVVKLYSPATLEVNGMKTANGICNEIAKCIGVGSISQVSQIISQARAYMNINSFREKVEYLAKEMKEFQFNSN